MHAHISHWVSDIVFSISKPEVSMSDNTKQAGIVLFPCQS